jgi:hypothetical protein
MAASFANCSQMMIHEAAYQALSELEKPTHVSVLYEYIESKGYYKFGAQNPANALAIQLSRRSAGVDIRYSISEKMFYRAAAATYGLLEWLNDEEVKGLEFGAQSRCELDLVAILGESVDSTEKERMVLARVGQGVFRSRVLGMWDEKCAVTGSVFAIRASHIKPWRDSTDTEKLDPNNGLPLVATLDDLFDSFLISFSTDGSMLISDVLSDRDLACLKIDRDMRLSKKPSVIQESYLSLHRTQLRIS